MTESELLTLYLQENFPSIDESTITDETLRPIWIAKAKAWYKEQTASGFGYALMEFRKIRRTNSEGKLTLKHYSDATTLQQACKALRKAGLMR